jgi:hypothetical protein
VLDLQGKVARRLLAAAPERGHACPTTCFRPPISSTRSTSGAFRARSGRSQMLHLRHPDPDDPMGRGVGKGFTLGDELDTDEYAARS